MLPPSAWAYARSSCEYASLMWSVPPNAASGAMSSRSRGRRESSMFTFTCAPSGRGTSGASGPSSRASTCGAIAESTRSNCAVSSVPIARPGEFLGRPPTCSLQVTSPSGVTRVTVTSVRIVAPARRAAISSSPETWPMPPTGTSQSPVPPPITWYSRQRFCSRPGSASEAKVPMSASVAITPRTRSWPTARSMASAIGASTISDQADAAPAASRAAALVGRGSVRVGNRAVANRVVRS